MLRRVIVQVEENGNCCPLPMHVFPVVGKRRPLFQIVTTAPDGKEGLCQVTGWCSAGGGTSCAANCVPVEDSGSSETMLSFVVYGGDSGLRFKAADLDESWSIDSAWQFGVPCLLLGNDPVIEGL